MADAPRGIYSVPLLGGDEHLVLESAIDPVPLPDSSLLVVRLNAQRKLQLFRFWTDSGRLQDLPLIVDFSESHWVSAAPNGKQAVAFGAPVGHENEGPALRLLDLDSGAQRPLLPGAPQYTFWCWAVTHDSQSVLAAIQSGSLMQMIAIPLNGRTPPVSLFTVANLVWYLDSGPDGSVYMSLTDRPAELVRRSLAAGASEQIASLPLPTGLDMVAALPDGRAVVAVRIGGHTRLVALEKGKDPISLISTTEETGAPMVVAGPREIAFVIGPDPHQTIAIADIASGRITGRIRLNKGAIASLASSPDGKTLYAAADGTIWALPIAGEPRKVRAGDSVAVDPTGRELVVGISESSSFRMFRVPVAGGPEKEIVTDGSLPLMGIALSPNSLSADGRLLHPLQPLDSWFNAPVLVDTATGRRSRIPSDDVSDYHSMAWLPDGRILALHVGLRSTLWKFQPRK